MNKLDSIALASLLLAAACGDVIQPQGDTDSGSVVAIDDGVLDQGDAPAKIIATSCADLRAQVPTADDDEHTLYVGGDETKPFVAWCHDMDGTPVDYLKLMNVEGSSNFAQYTAGGASSGVDVRTYYYFLRFDPDTLVADTSDQLFSFSTGTLVHGGNTVTSMPFGVAMACGGDALRGLANIDLRGTQFAVADTFAFTGNGSFGVIAGDAGMTNIDIEGGGFCGWMAPSNTAFDPMNTAGGRLQLVYGR
jgi:hypothetical protein